MRVLVIVGLLSVSANAYTVVTGGVSVDVAVTEPSSNSNGSALSDLFKTSVYYDAGSGPVHALDIESASVSGGGVSTGSVVVPWPAQKEGEVKFFATAMDDDSNKSESTPLFALAVDTLSPGASKTLTISDGKLFYNYREPIVNSDGTPLTDLASTKIYYNDSVSAALRLLGEYPATSPNGGGSQTVSYPLTMFIPGVTIRLYPRFLDASGNQSPFPQPVGIKLPAN